MKKTAIGIDLGCTNIKAVLIDEDGNVLQQDRSETNEQDHQFWKKTVYDFITDFKNRSDKIVSIGLCAPGLANNDNSCIAFMPGRLPGLENFNWSDFTQEKIWVLNDAHSALTAEASFGAAKGLQHILMLTLGSGVGGGILINGQLYQGMGQMAGHFGHITVDANTCERDVTNMPGSIEDAIGNITIEKRSHGKYTSTLALIDAYNRGEIFASWLWLSSVRKLSISIASAINMLSPEVVIIGGGIVQAGDALMKPLKTFLELYEWKPGNKQTPVKPAAFSDMAGAIGAAGFALSKHKK